MDRPNTVEEWYMDGLRFLRARYRFLSDVDLDFLEASYATAVAARLRTFKPERGRAFTWLCQKARGCYAHFRKSKGKESRCLMMRGVNVGVEAEDPGRVESVLSLLVEGVEAPVVEGPE